MPSIDKAYQWAVQACQSHNYRYVWGNNGQIVNGHPTYDCSSFVSAALRAGGFNCGRMTTASMQNDLPKLGFKRVTDGTVKSGDIGVNYGSHTEMAYTSGTNNTATWMGAHTSSWPGPYQVSIGGYHGGAYNPNYKRSFNNVWRYGDGASGEAGETPSSGKGYSAYVVAAICGNWWTESNVNPGVWESLHPVAWTAVWSNNTGGYGLGQWTNTGGDHHGRLYRLHEWLQSNHYADDSMNGQLEYLVVENYWTYKSAYTTYRTLAEFLNSDSTDLSTLTRSFLACWEGISDKGLQQRIEHAQTVYAYIIAHQNDPTPTPIAKNNYLSESEILNNSLYVFKVLGRTGTGNSQPTTGKAKSKMPVWMMLKNVLF